MRRTLFFAAAFSGLLADAALADKQFYSVSLGRRDLGTLQFDGQGGNATLLLSLKNTPFGASDGTFEAVARTNGDTLRYLGKSRGSETRDIEIVRTGKTMTDVTITPESEMTEMSEADNVPVGVIVPTEFFARVALGETCPTPMAMYDGRRVVQMTTTAAVRDGDVEVCEMSYLVVMGPGYVSPLNFKSFDLRLVYTARTLTEFAMSGGGFKVSLKRQ